MNKENCSVWRKRKRWRRRKRTLGIRIGSGHIFFLNDDYIVHSLFAIDIHCTAIVQTCWIHYCSWQLACIKLAIVWLRYAIVGLRNGRIYTNICVYCDDLKLPTIALSKSKQFNNLIFCGWHRHKYMLAWLNSIQCTCFSNCDLW